MPVRCILTSPANGTRLPAGTRELALRGAAWAGDLACARSMSPSISARPGRRQRSARRRTAMPGSAGPHSWRLPRDGYFEIWYRATDSNGGCSRMSPANWNPQGYGANPISRVAVLVG